MKHTFLIFLLLASFGGTWAQKKAGTQQQEPKAKPQPQPQPTIGPQLPETAPEEQSQTEDPAARTGTVLITKRVSNVGKGFRIQIYSGPDRAKAKETKVSFMKRFPAIRSYITYAAPYYRIRVGDFKTRGEAMDFYRHLGKSYEVMIVPSLINNPIPPKPIAPSPKSNNAESNSATDTAQ